MRVASVVDKLRLRSEKETCRYPGEEVYDLGIVGSRRGRGRPKNYWEEVIRHDMTHLHLIKNMTLHRG